MDAVRQRCRPKHQVLVLRCYPKHMKNNMEVKPNSSELNYLLYYASTRRSKLQKVGDFLDKRTTVDVGRGRIGNVQVTLQIIKALIEKCPRDLPLYAAAVFRIFKTILKSQEITTIEETVPTFETLCAHQDPASLAADHDYIAQYEDIINMYAASASKDTPIQTRNAKSVPVRIRYRKAGLEAIKAVAASDSLASGTGRQLAIIIPPILENLYADNGQYLALLEVTEEQKAEYEKQMAIRRRQSTSTVRTVEDNEGDPEAASGSTEAADKLAERETAVIALQALKKIFSIVPRGQLRLATSEVLKFMATRIRPQDHFPASATITLQTGSWPCTLFGMICSWAPVQDRYIILVTAMESLIRSPIVEADLEQQYVFATIIGWLLSSDINFIGLSVMDVLVGLTHRILLLLQLGGRGTEIRPHARQADAISAADVSGQPSTMPAEKAEEEKEEVVMEDVQTPSPARRLLLTQLQRCIGSLAVHVYYTEQINDMITAILTRLKPSPFSSIPNTISAVENPSAAADTIASSLSLTEKPNTDGFFSFDTARVAALGAVKEIVVWANWTKSDGSSNAVVRTPIGLSIWEGTQWLLRDSNWDARAAYVDALVIWMRSELSKRDLQAEEEQKKAKLEKKENGQKEQSLARRAVSNASQREKSPIRKRHALLQILHLAIYDNAHQYAESACDILLLHLLLSTMVQKLGVNALQHSLPMVMRLQDDISNLESPIAKVNVGSLVHGFLWAVSAYFDFDASTTGREIQNEISERVKQGAWLHGIKIPSMSYDQIMVQKKHAPPEQEPPADFHLKRFDNRTLLIDKVSESYSMAISSPSASPPQSPGRAFSVPAIYSVPPLLTHASSFSIPRPPRIQLPQKVKDALMVDWTRETCAEAAAKLDGSRSGSLSGSGQTGSGSRHLAVNHPSPQGPNGSNITLNGDSSPAIHRSRHHHHQASQLRARSPAAAGYGIIHAAKQRTSSKHASQTPTPVTSSSVRSAVRIEDLKRVLSGSGPTFPLVGSTGGLGIRGVNGDTGDDTGSDSMMSYEGSELSNAVANIAVSPTEHHRPAEEEKSEPDEQSRRQQQQQQQQQRQQTPQSRDTHTEGSLTPRPRTSSSASKTAVLGSHIVRKTSVDNFIDAREQQESDTTEDEVPPVPPLPPILLQQQQQQRQPHHQQQSSSPARSPPSTKPVPASPPHAISIVASERRPRTASSSKSKVGGITGGNGTGKSWSLKEARSSSPFGAKDVWGFSARDLLEGIDVEEPGLIGGEGVVSKPPY